MNLHLDVIVRRFPEQEIIVVMYGAEWHSTMALSIPPNLYPLRLSPYCPGLNSQKNVWKVLREDWFENPLLSSMKAVEHRLEPALKTMGDRPGKRRTVVAYPCLTELV